jgi:AP-1-like factor
MDPMTPNTSAFLSYLSSALASDPSAGFENPQPVSSTYEKPNPTSLPPSAFFNMPLPGRDTPEDTPPSSVEAPSQSPEKRAGGYDGLSPDTDEGSERGHDPNHKRKVGHGHVRQEEDDEEDGTLPSLPHLSRLHPVRISFRLWSWSRRQAAAWNCYQSPGSERAKIDWWTC